MGLPSINVLFQTLGITAIQRSQKGTVAMILQDEKETGAHTVRNITDIPKDLSVPNKEQIQLALMGYTTPPLKILIYVLEAEQTIEDALDYYETQHFDYLVGTPDITPEDASKIAGWIKAERLNRRTVKAVLPNVNADHEGIINFTTGGIEAGETQYTTAQYCARIAGLITGTPMTISCTFAPLPELSAVEHLSLEDLDNAIDDGQLVLFHDGEKVKIGRGVNSFVTTTQNKLDAFKKIKIVEAMDMIQNDIRKAAQDNYLGKYSNSYDNKCLLIMAIKGYFEELEIQGILGRGQSIVELDLEAQENYLKKHGIDTSEMTVQQLKEAGTGSYVFLRAQVNILDAIEDIDLVISI